MIRFLISMLLATLFAYNVSASMPTNSSCHIERIDPLSKLNAMIQSLTPQTHHKKISSKDPDMLEQKALDKLNAMRVYDVKEILKKQTKLDDSEIGKVVNDALNECNEMFVSCNKYELITALNKLINENLDSQFFDKGLNKFINGYIKEDNLGMFYHDMGESCNNLRSEVYNTILGLYRKKTNGDLNKTNTVTED